MSNCSKRSRDFDFEESSPCKIAKEQKLQELLEWYGVSKGEQQIYIENGFTSFFLPMLIDAVRAMNHSGHMGRCLCDLRGKDEWGKLKLRPVLHMLPKAVWQEFLYQTYPPGKPCPPEFWFGDLCGVHKELDIMLVIEEQWHALHHRLGREEFHGVFGNTLRRAIIYVYDIIKKLSQGQKAPNKLQQKEWDNINQHKDSPKIASLFMLLEKEIKEMTEEVINDCKIGKKQEHDYRFKKNVLKNWFPLFEKPDQNTKTLLQLLNMDADKMKVLERVLEWNIIT